MACALQASRPDMPIWQSPNSFKPRPRHRLRKFLMLLSQQKLDKTIVVDGLSMLLVQQDKAVLSRQLLIFLRGRKGLYQAARSRLLPTVSRSCRHSGVLAPDIKRPAGASCFAAGSGYTRHAARSPQRYSTMPVLYGDRHELSPVSTTPCAQRAKRSSTSSIFPGR